jgi:IclR family transcriptional regulator, mhp operon transcriptional activator
MKPIRTGLRLLRVLEALNTLGQASNVEVARALDLSTPTAYRLLQTLLGERYVSKNATTKLYRPAERVRALSIGFDEVTAIADCARPVLEQLGDELLWPVAIASVVGTAMIVHETTDARSPLAVRRVMPGRRVGLLDTASGRVFLAFCPAEQRDTLLDLLALSDDPRDLPARRPQAILRELKAVRESGYATSSRPGRVRPWCAVAVPVFAKQRLLATLSLRYTQGAIAETRLRNEVLGQLRATAAAVGRRFEEAFVAREATRPSRRAR